MVSGNACVVKPDGGNCEAGLYSLRPEEIAVNDQQFAAGFRRRTVGADIVGGDVTHSGFQQAPLSVVQLTGELTLQAVDDMAFPAPVIGQVSRTVFNDPNPQAGELDCMPQGRAAEAGMLAGSDGFPVDHLIGYQFLVHSSPRIMMNSKCIWIVKENTPLFSFIFRFF